jgi:3-hydroxyisobutyrate dehydrogenase-like beta-hydroxyacid dehydrogenase
MRTLGVVGSGEVGRCYGDAFAKAGDRVELCDIKENAPALALAKRLGVPLRPAAGPWLGQADLVLGCVEGRNCLGAALGALPHLKPGALWADFASADPAAKREAADQFAARGVRYVDIALVGAPSIYGARSPMILSGEGAEEFRDIMEGHGARVKLLAGRPAGDAIALKLVRSVLTKGMEALAVDCYAAAHRLGLREHLVEILGDIDRGPFTKFVEMLLRTHVVHASRRMHEAIEAERQLELSGLTAASLMGVKEVFRRSERALAAGKRFEEAPSLDEALDWMLRAQKA